MRTEAPGLFCILVEEIMIVYESKVPHASVCYNKGSNLSMFDCYIVQQIVFLTPAL